MSLPDPIVAETQDFGVAVTRIVDGVPFRAIVERPYSRALGVGGEQISITAAVDDVATLARGDEVEIQGERMAVVSIQPASNGSVTAQLETRGFLITLSGDWGLWIDEIEQGWPLSAPPGNPEYTTDLLRLRRSPGAARHILFSLPPTGPELPDGAVLDRAELRVLAVEAYDAPKWATFHVLRGLVQTQASWLLWRKAQPWDVPGAIGAAIDYDPDSVLGSGTGFEEGWNVVASGPAFTALLRANAAGRVPLLIWPTGDSADGETVLESVSPVEPQLLLHYRKGGNV